MRTGIFGRHGGEKPLVTTKDAETLGGSTNKREKNIGHLASIAPRFTDTNNDGRRTYDTPEAWEIAEKKYLADLEKQMRDALPK